MEKTPAILIEEIESALASRYNGLYTEYLPETYNDIIKGIGNLESAARRMEVTEAGIAHAELRTLKSLVGDLFSIGKKPSGITRGALPTYIDKTLLHLKGRRAFGIKDYW